jgi:sialic acid synthase SpsE
MKIKLGRKIIAPRYPALIVVEIASAHEGDLRLCKAMIREAGKMGADAIKFQMFSCDELIVPQDPRYNNFKKIELKEEEWKEIFAYAKKYDWEILAEVYDFKSANLAEELGVSGFKIPSSDLSNPFLIRHVTKKQKPVFLATGGALLEEIKKAVSWITSLGNREIVLIPGFQAYPTEVEDINLRVIHTLHKKFRLNIGYHDHISAESELAIILPSTAVALGARVIEKHFTLDRERKGFDYYSALEPPEFKKMISLIREVEKTLGLGKIALSKAEMKYRERMKKYIVARRDIKPDEVIKMEMLAFKRSKPGFLPSKVNAVLGKRARVFIRKNETITRSEIV